MYLIICSYEVKINESESAAMRVDSRGHVLRAFVNGQLIGEILVMLQFDFIKILSLKICNLQNI